MKQCQCTLCAPVWQKEGEEKHEGEEEPEGEEKHEGEDEVDEGEDYDELFFINKFIRKWSLDNKSWTHCVSFCF